MKKYSLVLVAFLFAGNIFAQSFTTTLYETEIPVREGHEVVFFDNYFWIMGGREPFQSATTNDLWRSIDGIHWEKILNHTTWDTRMNFSLFIFQNKLWIIGGESTRDANGDEYPNLDVKLYWKSDVWNSDNGIDWVKVIDHGPWQTRLSSAVNVFGDKLLLVGGHSTTNWNLYQDIYESEDALNWTKIGEINEDTLGSSQDREGLYEHDIIEFNNKLFLFGGKRASSFNVFNWVLESTDGLVWSIATKEPLWVDLDNALYMRYLRPFVFENKLWSIVANELLFSDDGIIWEKEMDLPVFNNHHPLSNPRTIVKDQSLYIYGSYVDLFGVADTVIHLIKLTSTTTSVDNNISSNTILYPNPVKNTLHIRNVKESYNYKIIDVSGKIIQAEDNYDKNSINIEAINKGIYILRITGTNTKKSLTRTFIKN